uniref:Nonstructural protein n=1 Tax=California sea lion astrovirus 4 TaxID=1073953 RepID=G1JYT5_9VIRU|nr:nonstructural protein [California sea lion astrovirus 4]
MVSVAPYFFSQADEDMHFGSTAARRHMTAEMINTLPPFHKDTPLHYDWIVRPFIFPCNQFVTERLVVVTGGLENGEYASYCFDGSWVKIQDLKHVHLLRYLRLFNRADSLRTRLRIAQDDHSTLILDHQLLRHELERLRGTTPGRRTVPMYLILLAGLLIFLCLFPTTNAQETGPFSPGAYKYWQGYVDRSLRLKDELEIRLKLALGNITFQDRIDALKQVIQLSFIPKFHYANYIFSFFHFWGMWNIFTIIMTVVTLLKSKNPVLDIVLLVLAHFSEWKMAILPFIPGFTDAGLTVAIVIMGIYIFDPYMAITAALLQFPIFGTIAATQSDWDFIQTLRSALLVIIATLSTHASLVLTGNSNYVFVIILTYRVFKLLTAAVTEKIELKDINGKVIGVIPTNIKTRAFNFAQKLKQLRNSVETFYVVKPDAICQIRVDGGVGTGFFLGNDIVTANHVVGNNKCVEVDYKGIIYQAKVRHAPEKDVCFITIPGDLKPGARFKLAKNPDYSKIVVSAYVADQFVVSTATGLAHGDTISYAMQTADGMSGAPVCDSNGRVLGVHQTNTGYTGGAVIVRPEDFNPVKEPTEVERLKAELEALREQMAAKEQEKTQVQEPPKTEQPTMNQCFFSESDIIALIRQAMQREMQVLRDELNAQGFGQKKKGKNKKGRGAIRRRAGFKGKKYLTEEEYKALLEKGLSREALLELIDSIIEERIGFPEWSDPEFSDDGDIMGDDIEYDARDWSMMQKQVVKAKQVITPGVKAQDLVCPKPAKASTSEEPQVTELAVATIPEVKENKEFCQRWGNAPVWEAYDFEWDEASAQDLLPKNENLTQVDKIILGAKITKLRTIIKNAIESSNYSELPKAVFDLDTFAWEMGLEGFLQMLQKKRKQQAPQEPKNGKRGPKAGPPRGTN